MPRKSPVLFAAFCLSVSAWAAEATWTKARSANFELYTTAGDRKAREGILYFERVQRFFSRLAKIPDTTPLPVRIVAFRSEKEYEPYRSREGAAAYFLGGHDRDYIVMKGITVDKYPIALHEYTHLLVRHSGMKLPLWLNEGMAELYSTLTAQGKKVRVGDLIPGRLIEIRTGKWIPLPKILEADHSSPLYNEKDRRGMFYSESWALVHMLALHNDYHKEFGQFLRALDSETPQAEALQKVYGLRLEELDNVVQGYVRGTRFNYGLFDIPLEKVEEAIEVAAAPEFEVAMLLADLLTGVGKQDKAQAAYEELARAHSGRPEAPQALGYLALWANNFDEARRQFSLAAARKSTSVKMYWDYYVLLGAAGGQEDESVKILERIVTLEPQHFDARMRLGYHHMSAGDYQEALEHLKKLRSVNIEQARKLFEALAYANYRAGDMKEAQAAVRRLRELARTPQQIDAAEKLARLLDPQTETAAAAAAARETAEDRPALKRASRAAPDMTPMEVPSRPGLPSVEGTLKELDCRTVPVKLIVEVKGEPVSFVIDSAMAIQLRGFGAVSIDLNCGPQKNDRVIVEYLLDEKTNPPTKLLRALELKPAR